MTNMQNKILLLVGPKGSGKSYIGRVIAATTGISYLRIEAIWQELKLRRTDFLSPDYIREGRALTLQALRTALQQGTVCIEATGVADDWNDYLDGLQRLAPLVFVRVAAPLEACRARASMRDQSMQVPIEPELFESINRQAADVQLDWATTLMNEPFLSENDLLTQLLPVLRQHGCLPHEN